MKHAVYIDLDYWQPISEGLRYILACVPEVTCVPASTACTGSSQQLATSAAQCNENMKKTIMKIKNKDTLKKICAYPLQTLSTTETKNKNLTEINSQYTQGLNQK